MNILSKTIKQAYAILRAHKFLWALGLFLFWDMGLNGVAYVYPSQMNLQVNTLSLVLIGMAIIFLAFLYFRSRATIILTVNGVLEKKAFGLGKNFRESQKYWRRLFVITFFVVFSMIFLSLILASPVVYLWSANLHTRASILAVFASAIFLPFAIFLSLVHNIAPLFVITFDLGVYNALRASFDMVRKFWPTMVFFSLWLGLITSLGAYVIVLFWRVGVVFFW